MKSGILSLAEPEAALYAGISMITSSEPCQGQAIDKVRPGVDTLRTQE